MIQQRKKGSVQLCLLIGLFLFFGLDVLPNPINVINMRGDTIRMVERGQRLYVFLDTPYVDEYRVFLGNEKIHELNAYEEGGPGWYEFSIPKKIDEREFVDVFEVEKKAQLKLQLGIGKDLNNILYSGQFTVVIDPKQDLRMKYAIGMALFLVLILFFVISRGDLNFIRDSVVEGIKKQPPFSLSKTQFAWWTLIILFSLLYVWVFTGEFIDINGRILTLLGISAGTTLGGAYISKSNRRGRIVNEIDLKKGSKSFLMDLIWADSGPSIHRMQNVIFTIVISSYLLFEVIQEMQFPMIDEGFMILMGISSGTYLALKSEEGSNEKEQIDG